MARTDYGTTHVGVRRDGRTWETFDRVTDSRIGPLHGTMRDAIAYADYRESATYGHVPGIPCDLAACNRETVR